MTPSSPALLALRALAPCALFLLSGCLSGDVNDPVPGSETSTMDTTTSGGNGTSGTTPSNNTATATPTMATTQACEGCINSRGACVKGDADSACGAGGGECARCDLSKGEACGDENTCVAPPSCDPTTCNGCCDGETCVPIPTDAACGAMGVECQDCTETGGRCGSEKICEPPCGPETCPGCCNGAGECVSGDSKGVCGSGGEACGACSLEQECEVKPGGGTPAAGQCVDAGCASSCNGCCDGDTCLGGAATEACGKGGAQCQDCGSSAMCAATTGKCAPKSEVTWDLMLLQGKFPEKKENGKNWDSFGGKPDPFVRAFYTDPVTGKEVSKKSSADGGTLTPKWNEVLFSDLNAQAILSDLKFDYIDDDLTLNDTLGKDCELADSNVLFDEKPHTIFCGQVEDAQGMITYAGGQFSVQLKRK